MLDQLYFNPNLSSFNGPGQYFTVSIPLLPISGTSTNRWRILSTYYISVHFRLPSCTSFASDGRVMMAAGGSHCPKDLSMGTSVYSLMATFWKLLAKVFDRVSRRFPYYLTQQSSNCPSVKRRASFCPYLTATL